MWYGIKNLGRNDWQDLDFVIMTADLMLLSSWHVLHKTVHIEKAKMSKSNPEAEFKHLANEFSDIQLLAEVR